MKFHQQTQTPMWIITMKMYLFYKFSPYFTKESEFPVMEYRHLGKSGLKVSVVSLGAWVNFGEKINEDAVVECIKMARKAGIVILTKIEN